MEDYSPTYQQVIDTMNDILKEGETQHSAAASLYAYTGEIDKAHIERIMTDMEGNLSKEGIGKTPLKRSFNIILEGLQNAYIHSKSALGKRFVSIAVYPKGEGLDIVLLTLTDIESMELVQSRVDKLNKMDSAEIKSHYRTVMSEGTLSAKGGAGLGLITMVMKSAEGMKLQLHEKNQNLQVMKTQLSV